ncbi:MAG: flavodoxin [Lentilactobacillus diolivorans]|jgi:flavodoxin short chain|uniref:Flavodoxin n=2 Tax=Lentilactobacillus diolivorans TaxID=179838 RepID=A0A0R1S0P6_9LACO|nr:flavodoxin [Lentilactobacillus diolivorans]RRG01128.1 MAG: flavodoxin [Lactobacillus sp.]KRL62593.1 flavodoxin [Lentilactobacillus diolivorans DSM 14421]MCH4165995.1 flavodoxin [Lentilactobacillus diolivorans]MDH5104671.1 flavodoxin [Lentilactobacillus diolivorans]GEP24751.1 flavodoxin [Lentilactobacillus diolivorans]
MITAHVVFATITGNNEDVADIITEHFEDAGVKVAESEISQTDPSVFEDVDICVVCPYTYDEGALPEEGLDFYDDLQELDLKGKIYGVAGSGDTFYEEFFNVAVDKFDAAFKKAGATKGAEDVKINLEPDEDAIETLDKFAEELISKVQK